MCLTAQSKYSIKGKCVKSVLKGKEALKMQLSARCDYDKIKEETKGGGTNDEMQKSNI